MSHEAESFAQRECDIITARPPARPIAQKTLRAFASVHRTPTRLGRVLLRRTQLQLIFENSLKISQAFTVGKCNLGIKKRRHAGLMVSALDYGLSCPSSSPDQGHCFGQDTPQCLSPPRCTNGYW